MNSYDDMMEQMLTHVDKEYLTELMSKLFADTYSSAVINATNGTIPPNIIKVKKAVLKVETLSKSHKIKGVRYKRKICFTPYIVRSNESKEEMIARANEVEQFIKDSCLRGYIGGGHTYTFECKKDAALAYLRFA